MENKIIDIHSHIVFDVDDGAKTIEDSINMIKSSYNQGVVKIVATPHYYKRLFDYDVEKIKRNFLDIKYKSSKLFPGLELYLGTEIFCSKDTFSIVEKNEFLTINSTRYVLIEFEYKCSFKEICNNINIFLMNGYIPVIAHVERYEHLDLQKVEKLIDFGCYMQINADSILKPKMFFDKYKASKNRARQYLKNELVHFVSSDMHNCTNRISKVKLALEEASKIVESDFLEDIFFNNASNVLKGIEI